MNMHRCKFCANWKRKSKGWGKCSNIKTYEWTPESYGTNCGNFAHNLTKKLTPPFPKPTGPQFRWSSLILGPCCICGERHLRIDCTIERMRTRWSTEGAWFDRTQPRAMQYEDNLERMLTLSESLAFLAREMPDTVSEEEWFDADWQEHQP